MATPLALSMRGAADAAINTLGGGDTVSVIRLTETLDEITGTPTYVTTKYSLRCLYAKWRTDEKELSNVQEGDKNCWVSASDLASHGITLSKDDDILDSDGVKWQVVDVKDYDPGAGSVIVKLHLRN